MNKRTTIVLAIVTALMFAGSAFAADAAKTRRSDTTEQRTGYQFPMPTQELPLYSFSQIATPSFTVGDTVPVRLNGLADVLDATRVMKAVRVGSNGGSLNFGDASITATLTPFNIASGSFREFAIDSNDPLLYVISNTGSITVKLQAW